MVRLSPVVRDDCKVEVSPTSARASRPAEAVDPVSKKSFDPSWKERRAGASPTFEGASTVMWRAAALEAAGARMAAARMAFLECVRCDIAQGRVAFVRRYSEKKDLLKYSFFGGIM
jgi:hypothetical protein